MSSKASLMSKTTVKVAVLTFAVVLLAVVWVVSIGAKPAAKTSGKQEVGVASVTIDASENSIPAHSKLDVDAVKVPKKMKSSTKRAPLKSSKKTTSSEVVEAPASDSNSSSTGSSSSASTTSVKVAGKGGWSSAVCSWYGNNLIGGPLASGGKLQADDMIVAHKTLPFGTKIEFKYNGKTAIATVKDRGPYIQGRIFDLAPAVAKVLGFDGVQTVQYRIL